MLETIKSRIPESKVYFNVKDRKHLQDYANFLKTSSWANGCKYILEFPFMDIPTMINCKITEHALKKYLK